MVWTLYALLLVRVNAFTCTKMYGLTKTLFQTNAHTTAHSNKDSNITRLDPRAWEMLCQDPQNNNHDNRNRYQKQQLPQSRIPLKETQHDRPTRVSLD